MTSPSSPRSFGASAPSPSPAPTNWPSTGPQTFRPMPRPASVFPPEVSHGEDKRSPIERGALMPDTRSASDNTLTVTARTGATGLSIERKFTTPGQDPFETVEWELRTASVGKFEQENVEFPTTWSQNATNIVAQKYFRGRMGTPERRSSVKQMIGRVAGTIANWGREGGYFDIDDDAQAFEDEL